MEGGRDLKKPGARGPWEPTERKDTSSEEASERSTGSHPCPRGPLHLPSPGPLLFLGRTWGAVRKSAKEREI